MYRLLAMGIFLAVAVSPLHLEGQMRAMQRPTVPVQVGVGPRLRVMPSPQNRFGGPIPRPFVPRSVFVGPAFRHHLRFGNACFTDPFFNPLFCRQFFFRNRFFFGQPVFLPYPVDTAPGYQGAEPTPVPTAYQESDLAREVAGLRDEVERLRDEDVPREEARQAALQPRALVEDKMTTVILVFRDGHRSEVQNFAIAGQTLWVFTDQRARKLPVSDLDVEATKKVNADRGVDFRLF